MYHCFVLVFPVGFGSSRPGGAVKLYHTVLRSTILIKNMTECTLDADPKAQPREAMPANGSFSSV